MSGLPRGPAPMVVRKPSPGHRPTSRRARDFGPLRLGPLGRGGAGGWLGPGGPGTGTTAVSIRTGSGAGLGAPNAGPCAAHPTSARRARGDPVVDLDLDALLAEPA